MLETDKLALAQMKADWDISPEEQEHKKSMELVNSADEPIPEGYSFSHYIINVGIRGTGATTSNPDDVMGALERILAREKDSESSIEILALFKHPDYRITDTRAFKRRSVLYQNKGEIYLDGERVEDIHDKSQLSEVLNSYIE